MKNPTATTKAVLDEIARPKTRSSLFWWLLDHYDAVVHSAEGRRHDWKGLCATFADQGLTDRDGEPATMHTARMTWWRVRKEKVRLDALRAAERAERESRAAANGSRPSRFPKGEYGPPLATTPKTAKPKLPMTLERQAELGLQLSTAEGVVITKVTRVFKLRPDGPDYVFKEDGTIVPSTNLASQLAIRQEMNIDSGRPVNLKTEHVYAKLELRSEYR
ncbi:hypothetical protein DFR50_11265 [Roseiarcus fermentans]|uniref:Uncharacterized protein n=2 Tax=Roseiarcus fermentans TaxID=1473586 RepID=A0A366FG57_9HYPH|nr:hypothetical protein DFR50_11265 [Roseiarcus fermentans]